MICDSCKKEIPDDSTFCPLCGSTVNRQTPGPVEKKVPNYLVQAILVTIFCCMPTGVAAIIFAAQVNGKLQSGDIDGAVKASSNAKLWCWVSLGVGIVVTVLFIAMGLFSELQNY